MTCHRHQNYTRRSLLTLAACVSSVLVIADARAADWSVAPGINFQHDWAEFQSDVSPLDDAADFRRMRLSVTAKHAKDLELKAEYDLFSNQWTDAYAKYHFADGHSLRAGQYKQPFFLEELTSDRNSLFMEQGLPSAMGIARRLGAEYAYSRPDWSVTVSGYGQNLEGLNKGTGLAARATWLPVSAEGRFLHLAAAVASEDPKSDRGRFSTRPEASLSPRRFADTGSLADVDSIQRLGLEVAYVDGPLLLQSEYVHGSFQRDGSADFSGDGYYLQAGWFLTEHARGYKNGTIDAPKLDGEHGAWELGLRYSHLDLDDGAVLGGVESNWTLGLTWWAHPNARLMANAISVNSDRRGVSDNPDILEFRAQIGF